MSKALLLLSRKSDATGSVRLSKRYIPGRRWPDSAIDLMDEAGASIKVGAALDGKSEDASDDGKKPQLLESHIADVIERKTGVPVSNMVGDEKERLLKMEGILVKRVVGQDDAIRAVSDADRKSRAGLKRPNQPVVLGRN